MILLATSLVTTSFLNARPANTGSSILVASAPLPTNPYVKTFAISHNSSDYSPFLISPVSEKTVFVVTIEIRNGKPPLAQILNFTNGAAKPVLANPLNGSIPSDIIYDRVQKRVWFFANDNLTYYDPIANRTTTEYTFARRSPQYMTIDMFGRIWLTLIGSNQIAEYDPIQRQATYFNVTTANAELQGITVAPDGAIWFTEAAARRIGRLGPCMTAPCHVTEYSPPPGVDLVAPIQVAVDHNGTVWFTDHGSNTFGSFNPNSNEWRVFPIGYCSPQYNPDCAVGLPNAISFDSSGGLWFSEHFVGRIARYDPLTETLTEYIVPATTPAYTWWMSPGPGNLVWFVAYGLGEIGYVNASIQVPISLSTDGDLNVQQAGSASIVATILNPAQNPVFLNVTTTASDAYDSPPRLYGTPSVGQINSSQNPQSVGFTITAAWNLSPGDRHITLTAYNSNVAVNAFVKVHVVSRLFLVQTIAPYLGTGFSLGLIVGTGLVYWVGRHKILPKSPAVRRGPKTRRARSR